MGGIRTAPSLAAFGDREGESFTAHRSDGSEVPLCLAGVERPAHASEGRKQFTLRFETVEDDHLPQGRYRVSTADLDPFDVIIVPVTDPGSPPDAVSYEAVFDREPSGDAGASGGGPSSSRRGVLAGALGALLGGGLLTGALGSPVGRAAAASSDPCIGEIRAFAFEFAPRGWAHCDGQGLPISQNQALFSLVGTRYGGDGQTTFNLPDLRGRAPIHHGDGPGAPRSMGDTGGSTEVSLSSDNLPSHTHGHQLTLPVSTDEGNATAPDGNALAAQPDARGTVPNYTDGATDGSMAIDGDVEAAGSGAPINTMAPYTTVNYCIALQGIYPSRD